MLNEGLLLAISQIAVTLAGFSGLVVAIRGAPPTDWHPRDIWSLSWMFGTSLGALFMALLPLLLASFALRDGLLWTLADLVMAAFAPLCIRHGAFWSTSDEIGTPAPCPLLSDGGNICALSLWLFDGAGHRCLSRIEDRILRFGSDRMLAGIDPVAGGVSRRAGAGSRSALVNLLIQPPRAPLVGRDVFASKSAPEPCSLGSCQTKQ
jgi:hypothetical protein